MEPDELITLRVQYLLDSDPLSATTAFPIPVRAPTYAFATTMPLSTQLATILRLLNAPQSVRITINNQPKISHYSSKYPITHILSKPAKQSKTHTHTHTKSTLLDLSYLHLPRFSFVLS